MSNLPGPDGRVSFREALTAANNTTGPQTIAFAIPVAEFWLVRGVALLRLEENAFFVNDSGTTIDFSTQTTNVGTRSGHLRPSPNGWGVAAIFINGDNCVIKGLGEVYQRGWAAQLVGNNNRVIGCQNSSVLIAGYMSGPTPSGNIVGGTAQGDDNRSGAPNFFIGWSIASLSLPFQPTQVLDAFLRMPERDRFLRGMVSWVGYRQIAVPYKREPRFAGTTNYPLSKMVSFAIDAVVLSFSFAPLRLAVWTGFAVIGLALLLIIYAVLLRFFADPSQWVRGWASLFVAIFFMGGVQLISLGIIGEYVGRIYGEVKQRPLYLVWERFGFHGTSLKENSPSAAKTRLFPNGMLPTHSFLQKNGVLREMELAKR